MLQGSYQVCRVLACGCAYSNSKMRAVNTLLRGTPSRFAPVFVSQPLPAVQAVKYMVIMIVYF